jgi:hypothetical protein
MSHVRHDRVREPRRMPIDGNWHAQDLIRRTWTSYRRGKLTSELSLPRGSSVSAEVGWRRVRPALRGWRRAGSRQRHASMGVRLM